jgi:hypothetical protein
MLLLLQVQAPNMERDISHLREAEMIKSKT